MADFGQVHLAQRLFAADEKDGAVAKEEADVWM